MESRPTKTMGPRLGDLRCRVLTPDKGVVYDQFVGSVELPTTAGRLEIFPRYEPTVAPLRVGVVTAKGDDGSSQTLAIHGGYVDMNGKVLHILADSAELGNEIDVARAQAALEKAKEDLAALTSKDPNSVKIEIDRAKLAIARAMTRLDVAGEPPSPR